MDCRDAEAEYGSWYKSFDKERMIITVEIFDEDEEEEEEKELEFPAKFEVCGLCDGKGKHVNPSIDSNGITGEEMYELGDDFRDDYMNGFYDVSCYRCKGQNVEPAIDEGALSKEQKANLKEFEEHQRSEAYYRAECEAERRMGA